MTNPEEEKVLGWNRISAFCYDREFQCDGQHDRGDFLTSLCHFGDGEDCFKLFADSKEEVFVVKLTFNNSVEPDIMLDVLSEINILWEKN